MIAHVAWAFAKVHGWSHAAAVEATARQVEAVTGWGSGGGVWANYAFVLAWIAISGFWTRMNTPCRRAWWAVFFFMGFNGAVVFVHGPARWLGMVWAVVATVSFARGWTAGALPPEHAALRVGGNGNPP